MSGAMTRAVRTAQFQDLSDAYCEPIALTSAYVFSSAADAANKFSGVSRDNAWQAHRGPTKTGWDSGFSGAIVRGS